MDNQAAERRIRALQSERAPARPFVGLEYREAIGPEDRGKTEKPADSEACGDVLDPGELRKSVKVRVTGKQDKRMLQDEGCDPHIIRWDGRALLAQLPINGGVMMRRLVVGIEHTNARFKQKAAQHCFVLRSLGAHCKSGAQFPEHDKG